MLTAAATVRLFRAVCSCGAWSTRCVTQQEMDREADRHQAQPGIHVVRRGAELPPEATS